MCKRKLELTALVLLEAIVLCAFVVYPEYYLAQLKDRARTIRPGDGGNKVLSVLGNPVPLDRYTLWTKMPKALTFCWSGIYQRACFELRCAYRERVASLRDDGGWSIVEDDPKDYPIRIEFETRTGKVRSVHVDQ